MVMKKMRNLVCHKDKFWLLACFGLTVIIMGFLSCSSSPGVQKTGSGRGSDGGASAAVQTVEDKLGSLQIFYVDSVTMAFKEGSVQVIKYPERELVGLEIPFDTSDTYRQLWDDNTTDQIADAISRFGVAERSSAFGTVDSRSFTFYGTAEANIEWVMEGNANPLTVDTSLDLGYVVKDRKTYFLITQRDTQVTEEDPALRTTRVTFCVAMEEIRKMMGMLGIRLYEKPLMVFLGDGVTAGTNAAGTGEDDPASAYPAILQDMVTCNILNAGAGWTDSADALYRVEDILKYDPDIVVVNVGLMDLDNNVDPTETARNLQAIIDALGPNQRKIFLVRFYDDFVLQYVVGDSMSEIEQTNLMNVYDGIFRSLVRVNNVELITGIWDGLQHNDTISYDGYHPTKEGHKIMAGNFYNALKVYLGAQNYLKQ